MKPKQTGITVFFSYAQADQAVHDQLAIHLSQLKQDGLIEERQILAGSNRTLEIDQALRRSHIILLLISANFLASDACYDVEMQQALERHRKGEVCVIPIIVHPCDWQHSPFAHLQCLPRNAKPISTWRNRNEAFVSIVQELRKVIAQQQSPPSPLSSVQSQNRTQLLKRVRKIWIEGLLDQSLHQAAWIDLQLQEQPDALENPWRLQVQELNQSPCTLPVGTSIIEVYDDADGELLILGEPGAGKTTLLLQLARTLLDRAEADEHVPVPVVFNLSSWAQKSEPLATWLVEELKTKYHVPPHLGRYWLEANQILPLLDGLDEVAPKAREDCVKAVIGYQQSQSIRTNTPLVVCCRCQEYAALSTHFPFTRAVSILPLTEEQIEQFFQQAGDQLATLRTALQTDTELAELARFPLMLNIFALTYQNVAEADLPRKTDSEAMRSTVFAHYTEKMLTRRVQLRTGTKEEFLQRLIYLAHAMQREGQTVFHIKNIQPQWVYMSNSSQRIAGYLLYLQFVFYALAAGPLAVMPGLLLIVPLLIPQSGTLVHIILWVLYVISVLLLGVLLYVLRNFLLHIHARFLLSRFNLLPWKVELFLDEAVERLLLHKAGNSYIFIHKLLLEYLATQEEYKEDSFLSLEVDLGAVYYTKTFNLPKF
jgi:DNA polymerase III delta prime subunit